MRVTVLGCGSWGSALALVLARNGHDVALLGRDPDEIAAMRATRENLRYLPGFVFPEGVQAGFLGDAPADADFVVAAMPSQAFRDVIGLTTLAPLLGRVPLLIASKGLDVVSARLLSEVAEELHPGIVAGVITGPNLATEMVRGIPTAAVAAFEDQATTDYVRAAFVSGALRVYRSSDRCGLQLAGALKNVVAIAAGMSDGLGFGDNTKGALLARGWREMLTLGLAMGAKAESFMGIAGIGDLFATAASSLSRNYRLGRALGTGSKLAAAIDAVGQVAEGVPTAEAAVQLARRHGVSMPIFESIEAVLRGRMDAKRGVALLMERETPDENIPFCRV
ncbi:MAG: NAD(P)H-dependent glycerol-3-phosphate dehydrogenase [Fimbriimonadaceae bacterium]